MSAPPAAQLKITVLRKPQYVRTVPEKALPPLPHSPTSRQPSNSPKPGPSIAMHSLNRPVQLPGSRRGVPLAKSPQHVSSSSVQPSSSSSVDSPISSAHPSNSPVHSASSLVQRPSSPMHASASAGQSSRDPAGSSYSHRRRQNPRHQQQWNAAPRDDKPHWTPPPERRDSQFTGMPTEVA